VVLADGLHGRGFEVGASLLASPCEVLNFVGRGVYLGGLSCQCALHVLSWSFVLYVLCGGTLRSLLYQLSSCLI
jgi:hypothetical protein